MPEKSFNGLGFLASSRFVTDLLNEASNIDFGQGAEKISEVPHLKDPSLICLDPENQGH